MKNNELEIFKNQEFGEVRSLMIDEKPYFVGKDIAKCLGYSNPRDAISRHCKGVVKHDSFKEGGQMIGLIPEGDIYRLIIKSKLPKAQQFESWVMDEVLPTIRKHGAYMTDNVLEKAVEDPDFMIGILTKLKEEQEITKKQKKLIEDQQPKVILADKFTNTDGLIEIKILSKILDIPHLGRTNLFKWMRDQSILMEGNIPYQRYHDYFKVVKVFGRDGRWHNKTMIKPKGVLYIIKRLIKDNKISKEKYSELIKKVENDIHNVA
ncbi:phage antirepressor [Clostridium sardiniense]|uniref:phage antirepressor n=1 Tax=Clostridium sardiniense TaxID=29369 RepID=UPI001957170A|nr:phage antirepressor [Clostridium sardiniense]MBM7835720.1 prophage antirepressor-like protein [Clostridium sardiniense]